MDVICVTFMTLVLFLALCTQSGSGKSEDAVIHGLGNFNQLLVVH